MKNTKLTRILAAFICLAMMLSVSVSMVGCGDKDKDEKKKPDALVIMTEELDGLFNPFYSTTANDATIVAMTQIAMLSTAYVNGEVEVAYGDNEAVVVKDYSIVHNDQNDQTVYTFVIKNGIKFSDGKPLTMNDVLFNLYVYLDPVYTGSSTMYSTDIVGLADYRTQTAGASDSNTEDNLASEANARAKIRIDELINLFRQTGKTSGSSYDADYETMKDAISKYSVSPGYQSAVSAKPNTVTNAQLLEDYEYTLKLFREELERDYNGAASNFSEEPYKSYTAVNFADPIIAFMALEGYVSVEYVKVNGKEDKSQIEKVTLQYNEDVVKTKEDAINYVYNSKIGSELDIILSYWGTAATLKTEYAANAKEILLRENMTEDGLLIPNIEGIVSLGHSTTAPATVTIGDNTYNVAKEHNTDGTPVDAAAYDVLQITINGVDPKAIWNFAFSVAPQHYYAEGYSVDIANNNFGLEYGSFDFMKNVIQSKNRVPMGAGPYKASNASNGDNPTGTEFYANNVVYYKANQYFMMGVPKIEKLRYQVVSSSNALSALESGSVHFVSPQFTQLNIDKINSLKDKGIEKLSTDQLGYGYIGINAGKVQNINLRKAIMSAMDISLALSYYSNGTAENICWPMSTVSWAYPKDETGALSKYNGKDFCYVRFTDEEAIANIQHYMEQAGVSAGDSALKMTFTIAGANMTEHPAYLVFQKAATLLNSCGWDITVAPDVQALTKLSTGSLTVWAAAWGSTVDPDMYQVYHKKSTATSVLAWGYNVIVDNDAFPEENAIINDLSAAIEAAREIEDREERAALYEEAMGYVLDLAIELPVYQRDVLYAYDSTVIKSSTLPAELNPYTSPLDSIWNIEFAD